ncbi:protein MKS1 [Cornus florida]|uniref:protein MKS1 n=1 Tax=Cornus florida TaxID=4283 RepID=UPI00289F6C27|nr:protein MKS1 [Cornus florida]
MDLPDFYSADRPSPTRRELQGPRPTPLKVNKDSYKIKKPPVAPQPQPQPQPRPPPQQAFTTQRNQPLIIFSVSPKVIHTTVSDYKDLVQRLTGASSSSGDISPAACGGDISPAARIASIERTSPKERDKERERTGDLMGSFEGVEMGQIPGILSPAPATLAPIPCGFFSPSSDPHAYSLLNDLSPFMYGNMFIQSPSALLSTPMLSPSPSSSYDLFNLFS